MVLLWMTGGVTQEKRVVVLERIGWPGRIARIEAPLGLL